jgi:hypothetical protein
MQQFDIAVPGSGGFVVHGAGRYFKYLGGSSNGSDSSLVVTPGGSGGSKIVLLPGQAYRIADNKPTPDSWTLASNIAGVTITGKVVIGDGRIDDNTLSGVVSTVDGGKLRTMNNQAFAMVCSPGPVAAQYSMGQIWNPAGSGMRLVVEAIGMNNNGANTIVFWSKATAALGTLVGNGCNKRIASSVASVGLAYIGSSAVQTPDPFRIACHAILQWNYVQQKLAEPIVIEPGYGLNCQNAGAQNAGFGVQFEWYEEPNV